MSINISVVVPCYNRERTIKRCIESIVNQTVCPFEIIVVDDGSTDQTIRKLEEIDCEYLKIIKQNHRGPQAARNLGIVNAQGNYIAFLDSDDEWMPNKLEVQICELQKNPNAVICGDGYRQFDWYKDIPKVYGSVGQRKIRTGTREPFKLHGASGYVYKKILHRSFCLFPSILVSKKSLYKIGLLDEKVPSYQEWDTSIRLAKDHEFVYIRRPLFVYHLHDGETISKDVKKEVDGLEYVYKKFQKEFVCQLGSSELAQKYKELMNECIKYRDARVLKFFVKYVIYKVNICKNIHILSGRHII